MDIKPGDSFSVEIKSRGLRIYIDESYYEISEDEDRDNVELPAEILARAMGLCGFDRILLLLSYIVVWNAMVLAPEPDENLDWYLCPKEDHELYVAADNYIAAVKRDDERQSNKEGAKQ